MFQTLSLPRLTKLGLSIYRLICALRFSLPASRFPLRFALATFPAPCRLSLLGARYEVLARFSLPDFVIVRVAFEKAIVDRQARARARDGHVRCAIHTT
jgi:hypothetical protein